MVEAEEMTFVFRANDYVTGVYSTIAGANDSLATSVDQANAKLQSQEIAFIGTMTAVQAVYGGMRRMIFSLRQVGLLTDEDAMKLQKFTAVVGVFVSTFQMIKGAIQLVNKLRQADTAYAGVKTYLSILENPAKAALAIGALTTAAFATGYLLRSGNKTASQVTQNVNINSNAPYDYTTSRNIARDSMSFSGA